MAKTYVPSAVDIATQLNKYLARYSSTLLAGVSAEKAVAFAHLVTCLGEFLAVWAKPEPTT